MKNDRSAEAVMLTKVSPLITCSNVSWDMAMLPEVLRGFPFNHSTIRTYI